MARRLGQVHGGDVGREHVEDLGVGARSVGRAVRERLDRRRRGCRRRRATPRTPGCSVATNGPGAAMVSITRPPWRATSAPSVADGHGAGQQRPVEDGARRGARSRPSADAGRTTTSSAATAPARAAAHAAGANAGASQAVHTGVARDAGQRRRRGRRAVADQHAPGRRTRPRIRRRRPPAAPSRTGHDGDAAHTAAPARSPSTTAAWARRGATQSPTRSDADAGRLQVVVEPLDRVGRHGEHDPVGRARPG